jgi:hypothetical protein
MSSTRIGRFAIERIVEQQRPYGLAQSFFNNLTDEMLARAQRELP